MSNFGKFILVFSLFISMLVPAQQAYGRQESVSTGIINQSTGDIGWTGRFTVNGVQKLVNAVVIDGQKVYIGGYFTVTGDSFVNNIAVWDGSTWDPLGIGVNSTVTALAVDGRGNLYAGGLFTEAGGNPANHIARWNGQTWDTLGDGIDGLVYSIAVDGFGNVYAGGQFVFGSSMEIQSIAKWNGITWSALQSGVSIAGVKPGFVYTMTIDRYGFLYVGGRFDHAGGIPANNIARWDGTNWSALGNGMTKQSPYDAMVNSIAADSRGNVYAGGQFDAAGGIPALNFARWNGESWSEAGGGIQSNEQIKAAVTSIIADGGNIYVGGNFNAAGGNLMSNIAIWNGVTWENMGGGISRGNYLSYIAGMAIDRDGRIFTAGVFTMAGGKCTNSVAVWNGASWSGLGADTGPDGTVTAMVSDRKGGYFLAGDFICAGGQIVNHIVHWDGGAVWSTLSGGLSGGAIVTYPRALVLDSKGNLFVGGEFTQAGNLMVNRIAEWNGSNWEAVGDGPGFSLNSLAIDSQDHLYAGGYFYIPGSNPSQYYGIKMWDGSQWQVFGGIFDGSVYSLAFDSQGQLIVGGYFNTAGGVTAHGIARWNGQTWEALADGNFSPVWSIITQGKTIYAGGIGIWKIQNGTYENIGGGISGPIGKETVYTMALDRQGRLIIGGLFEKVGSTVVNNLARWNGLTWEAFGSGLKDGVIYALNADTNGKLVVAGGFYQAGGNVSQNLAVWTDLNYLWFPLISR